MVDMEVVVGRHGVSHMRGTDANANASTPTKRAWMPLDNATHTPKGVCDRKAKG